MGIYIDETFPVAEDVLRFDFELFIATDAMPKLLAEIAAKVATLEHQPQRVYLSCNQVSNMSIYGVYEGGKQLAFLGFIDGDEINWNADDAELPDEPQQ